MPLCLLNACEGARSDRTDVFSGVAQRLVQQGLPAVIAMQFEITDAAAITLCHEFYSAMADGYPVDAALAEGRKSIYVRGNDIEWGTPVLYMRSNDGQLFAVDTVTAPQASTVTAIPESSTSTVRQMPKIETPTPAIVEPQLPQTPIDFDWIEVPAGEFQMGGDGEYDGKPVHTVFVDDFRIAKTPITNCEYKYFVDATGHKAPHHWMHGQIPNGKEDHPVVVVSWDDAQAFCNWAGVRLPTEAEWEKAAAWEAETKTKRTYPWGEQMPDKSLCNFEVNVGGTTPVDAYPKGTSPYGCLDMAGNVWEWTSTERRDYPYRADDGREKPDSHSCRVLRGGAFVDPRGLVRCAYRDSYAQDGMCSSTAGFVFRPPAVDPLISVRELNAEFQSASDTGNRLKPC